jgi:hypothetical protein
MNAGIKAQWGEWLLAHADQQGQGVLRRKGNDPQGADDTYCCLGGLCELAVAAGIVQRTLTAEGTYKYGNDTEAQRSGVLPDSVADWAGLHDNNPRVRLSKASPSAWPA